MSNSLSPAARLVEVLRQQSPPLAAYIVPSADAHQSEYTADCDKRRAFISGFTGSAGTALILAPEEKTQSVNSPTSPTPASPPPHHRLWTDGRYFAQAAIQLDPNEFVLMKAGLPETPKLEDFLLRTLPKSAHIGVDASLMSVSQYRTLQQTIGEQLTLVNTDRNLVDTVWSDQRPLQPLSPLIILSESYSGNSHLNKIKLIREKLKENKCYGIIITALDEIAWLLNLRGGDVTFNPVFFSYIILTMEKTILFINKKKINSTIEAHLGSDIQIEEYHEFMNTLVSLTPYLSKDNRIWLDINKVNYAIYSSFDISNIYEADSPLSLLKAIKNENELNGMRQAHIRDGIAVCQFLHWLEHEVSKTNNNNNNNNNNNKLTECTVSDKLETFRAAQHDFVGLSFDTIAGSGKNGAIIHYKPEPESCAPVDDHHMFLLDSGGQYLDGTTDITRTIHLGQPTAFERYAFTKVLQGHIALATAVFPPNTVGPSLDTLARTPLWQVGLDYLHGTGHGVGCFLNVHEGPHGISSSTRSFASLTTPLQAGMIVTDEPGYYHDDPTSPDSGFGIRIESVLIVIPVKTKHTFGQRQYLGFDTITLVPIQKKLIDLELLFEHEIIWLNDYHLKVRETLSPFLQGDQLKWLHQQTEAIPL